MWLSKLENYAVIIANTYGKVNIVIFSTLDCLESRLYGLNNSIIDQIILENEVHLVHYYIGTICHKHFPSIVIHAYKSLRVFLALRNV